MSDIKLNVVRTTKDKIFDIVFLVLTLTIWGIIIWLISRAPDIVPTHFGPSGKPDHYGSPTFIIIPDAWNHAIHRRLHIGHERSQKHPTIYNHCRFDDRCVARIHDYDV